MSGEGDVETWTKVALVQADCLMCGEVKTDRGSAHDQAACRGWARRHAAQNPGHHVVVEVTRSRSYLIRR